MKYALFLGCTIPARSRNYELSARKVAEELGIELVDIERFICCGFPVKSAEPGCLRPVQFLHIGPHRGGPPPGTGRRAEGGDQ
ncbi:MAG: hypothetical protein JRJ01_15935 [Deltaproteobacteria bacterium]|nr:hypothetical protein [Deltaproteobacteria bacterium]